MKRFCSLLLASLSLAFIPAWSRAATFQVVADTSSSIAAKGGAATISKAAGSATTLPVSSKSDAYIYFGLVGAVGEPPATAVSAARLVFYVQSVAKPGTISVSVAGTNGDPVGNGSNLETVMPFGGAKTYPAPTAGSAIQQATVSAASAKHFIVVDVTPQVQAWLKGSVPEFGFAISSDGTASVLIGSKEGSGNGYPAVLEVDVNGTTGNLAAASGDFETNVVVDNSAADNGDVHSGLIFGGGGSGEGIASDRMGSSFHPNPFGLDLFTAGVQRLSITQSGKVGIGTTNPGAALEIDGSNGTQVIISDSSNGFAGILEKNVQRSYFVGISDTSDRWEVFDVSQHLTRLSVTFGGNVGIGTTTPSAALEVNGGIKCIGPVDTTSDARYKLNIQPLAGALAQTLRLRGVSYEWDRAQFPEKGFNDRRQLGFIAQEVREILPDVVSEDPEGYLSIGYSAIIPVLAEAVKELKQEKDAEIAALKTANAALVQKLTALEARDAAREARLTRLESALDERPAHAVRASVDLR